MKIHTFDVGPGHPCLVVAEFGSNHGGSFDAAIALVDAAADAGANAVKGQLWLSADEMYDREQFPQEWASADRYRLPAEWLPALRDRAHERGMAFGLSSFGFASLDIADACVDFHKVASIEHSWIAFSVAVVGKNKPTLVSIGMDNGDDMFVLSNSLLTLRLPIDNVAWLQCAVSYPSELADTDLRSLTTLRMWANQTTKRIDEHRPIGLSDHTLHPTIAPCAAVALGACVIEKHIRLWNGCGPVFEDPRFFTKTWQDMSTPDADHSLAPSRFAEMVDAIRLTESALGAPEKRIRESEQPYLKYRRGPKGLRGA